MDSAMRDVEVVAVRLDGSSDSPEERAGCLSIAERKRAARYHSELDRRRYIIAHVVLRELLAQRVGRPPECLRLESEPGGKPRLAQSRLRFSLSRSGALAVYAFAEARAVGVDVEAVRPIAEADAIARIAFPPREWHRYSAHPAHERTFAFIRAWTRIEALAKATGAGLGASRERLEAALVHGWSVRNFASAPGFAAALACQEGRLSP